MIRLHSDNSGFQRQRSFIVTVLALLLVTVAPPTFAASQVQVHDTQLTEDRRHAFSGLFLPLLAWNQAALAYEFAVTDRLGIRADLGGYAFMGGAMVHAALGVTYQPAQLTTRTARHGLELGLLPMVQANGAGGYCEDVDGFAAESQSRRRRAGEASGQAETEVHRGPSCDDRGGSGFGIKTIVGYRYQKHSGFQIRLGFAPLMELKPEGSGLELVWVSPEMSLGWVF
ncbi:MAG: hypothetical protein VYE15_02955 [Myxococcota bacterium]|nr:hypothetical protein [Myxococcota bacterium]